MEPKLIFQPVVGPNLPGAFLTEHSRDSIPESALKRQFLTGITYNEGLLEAFCKNMIQLVLTKYYLVDFFFHFKLFSKLLVYLTSLQQIGRMHYQSHSILTIAINLSGIRLRTK